MSCRCGDIRRCSQDIDTLNQMLKKLNKLSNDDQAINRNLFQLAINSSSSVTPDNIYELTNAETKLNENIHEHRCQMVTSCQAELNRLHSRLSSMKSEDKRYHEEEDDDD